MQPIITLIVAASSNDAIGKDNKLPWRLPSELKHFKEYTLGKILVCGKNTFLSLPSLLKNRHTIILSKNENTIIQAQEKVDLFKSRFPLEEVPFIGITDSVYNFLISYYMTFQMQRKYALLVVSRFMKNFIHLQIRLFILLLIVKLLTLMLFLIHPILRIG